MRGRRALGGGGWAAQYHSNMLFSERVKASWSASVSLGTCGRHTKSTITPTVQYGESAWAEASIASRKGSSMRSCAPIRSGWNQSSHAYEKAKTGSEALFSFLFHSLSRHSLSLVMKAAGGMFCRPHGSTPPSRASRTRNMMSTSGVCSRHSSMTAPSRASHHTFPANRPPRIVAGSRSSSLASSDLAAASAMAVAAAAIASSCSGVRLRKTCRSGSGFEGGSLRGVELRPFRTAAKAVAIAPALKSRLSSSSGTKYGLRLTAALPGLVSSGIVFTRRIVGPAVSDCTRPAGDVVTDRWKEAKYSAPGRGNARLNRSLRSNKRTQERRCLESEYLFFFTVLSINLSCTLHVHAHVCHNTQQHRVNYILAIRKFHTSGIATS